MHKGYKGLSAYLPSGWQWLLPVGLLVWPWRDCPWTADKRQSGPECSGQCEELSTSCLFVHCAIVCVPRLQDGRGAVHLACEGGHAYLVKTLVEEFVMSPVTRDNVSILTAHELRYARRWWVPCTVLMKGEILKGCTVKLPTIVCNRNERIYLHIFVWVYCQSPFPFHQCGWPLCSSIMDLAYVLWAYVFACNIP